MPDEIDFVLNFCLHILRSFGFSEIQSLLEHHAREIVGESERWPAAEAALEASLERSGLDYEVDEGGGAFYGPKIDLKVKDAIGREWQLSTIQFDFNEPERFDLTYIGEDGQPHRPYHDPPRPDGQHGTVLWHPDRTLRWRIPGLALSRAGDAYPNR